MVLVRTLSNSTSSPLTRAVDAYHRLDLFNPHAGTQPRTVPKRARRLNAVQLAGLTASYEGGATVYDLADRFGIDRRTVSLCLKRMGVSLRGQSPSDDAVNEMVRLYEEGLSLAAVGSVLGVSAKTVHTWIRRRGVTTRPQGGGKRGRGGVGTGSGSSGSGA